MISDLISVMSVENLFGNEDILINTSYFTPGKSPMPVSIAVKGSDADTYSEIMNESIQEKNLANVMFVVKCFVV